MADIIKGLGQGVGDIAKGVANAGIIPTLPTLSLPLPTLSLPLPPLGGQSSQNSTTDSASASASASASLNNTLSEASITPNVTLSQPEVTPTPNNTIPIIPSDSTITQTNTIIAANQAHSSAAPAPKGFLENKPLAGAVLGLAGLVGLVLIFVIGTWALRRRNKGRLMDEAISFEPTSNHYPEDMERLNEKASISDGYAGSYGAAPVQQGGYYNASAGAYHGQHAAYPQAQFTLPSQSGY